MERQVITVDIAPGNSQVVRLGSSQGDIGRPMGVYIIQNGVALDCSAYSAELYIIKPDGKFYTTQATVDATEKNLIKWETALQETPVAGACAAQIRITAGDDDIGTARFVEFVEASPGDMGTASESEVALLTEYVRQARESATSAGIDATTASGAASSASGSASTASAAASTATQAASTATAAAERAEDVAESIPEDYSQLSDDVSGLKSAINASDDSLSLVEDKQDISLTMNQKWGCSIGRKAIETDYGGAFYLSSAVTVSPGELYRITGKGYGSTAAFALGNNGTVIDVYPTSYASTSEYHFTDKMLIQIPDGINEVYVSNCTIGTPITPKLEKVVNSIDLPFGERVISQVISTNTHFRICPPIHYRGNNGKYIFKLDFTSVATNSSIAFRVYNGSSSIANLNSFSNINTGDKITYEVPETSVTDVATAIGFVFYANGSATETFTVKVDYYVPESVNKSDLDLMALHRKHGRMEFGAHMGAKAYAPAGSYAAYRVAGEMGFDWAWIAQVKHSADGTLWVCHDDTLNSITDYTGSKTIFEMTDTEILACKCNTIGLCYKLTDFSDAELHIPTLEEVVMLCVKFGMKMYFRCDDITDEYAQGNRTAAFVDMIKGHGIGVNEAAYSIYDNTARMNVLRTNLGNDIEISLFFSPSTTAQTYIDWFNTNNVTNRSVIMPLGVLTKADVQLLHKNNVKVYSYSNGPYELSRANVIQCAEWGIDAIQSGCWYYLPY